MFVCYLSVDRTGPTEWSFPPAVDSICLQTLPPAGAPHSSHGAQRDHQCVAECGERVHRDHSSGQTRSLYC